MPTEIDKIKAEALSEDLEVRIGAIDKIVKDVDALSSILLKSLETAKDRLFVAEKISKAFYDYIRKLDVLLETGEEDLSFWAATLLVHYGIKNAKAEELLLKQAVYGSSDNASVAIAILSRMRIASVKQAINERLSTGRYDRKMEEFLKERLSDINLAEET